MTAGSTAPVGRAAAAASNAAPASNAAAPATPRPGWDVLVVVPAHDEEALIGRCLRALREAAAVAGVAGHRVRHVVVADSCHDGTADVARGLLGPGDHVVEVAHRNVGRARSAGVRAGLVALGGVDLGRVWIANTDADSAVPPDWITRQLAHAERGWVAVAGVVMVDSFAGHPRGAADRFGAAYRTRAAGHPHVHGANLAVRADAYVDVAGWPPAPLAEDHGLWTCLGRAGWPTFADSTLTVLTSGRLVGRAAGGFAATLAGLTGAASASDGAGSRA